MPNVSDAAVGKRTPIAVLGSIQELGKRTAQRHLEAGEWEGDLMEA